MGCCMVYLHHCHLEKDVLSRDILHAEQFTAVRMTLLRTARFFFFFTLWWNHIAVAVLHTCSHAHQRLSEYKCIIYPSTCRRFPEFFFIYRTRYESNISLSQIDDCRKDQFYSKGVCHLFHDVVITPDLNSSGCLALNGWHRAALTLSTACWHLHLSPWNDVTLSPGMCGCVYMWDNICQTACSSEDAGLVPPFALSGGMIFQPKTLFKE